MDHVIEQIIQVMRKLTKINDSKKWPKLDQEAVRRGLEISRTTCAQPETVAMTPIMKNMLDYFGDIKFTKNSSGEWEHTYVKTGQKTKAVAWLNEVVNKALAKYNGKECHDYPEKLPISDIQYYNVDCWNGWKPEVWDIQPGQAEQRRKGFLEYKNPKTNYSVEQLIKEIQRNAILRKAILTEFYLWPEVQASRDVKAISDPFMSKGTGVSYPYYRNDRSIVKKGSDVTYGKLAIEDVKRAYSKGGVAGLTRFALENNVYTGYPRNQRGKGRPLIAQSRRTNLVINMVNSPEMELWKSSTSLGLAFWDEEKILACMKEFIETSERLKTSAYNIDYSAWDRNLGAGWVCLENAMRYLRAKDDFTRKLIEVRYMCGASAYFLDGPNNAVYRIYGRQMSGYDDTTLGNTTAQRVLSRWCAYEAMDDYSTRIHEGSGKKDLFAVGDDLLLMLDDNALKKFVEHSKKTGAIIHEDEKHAKGAMFIQWRCFKNKGQYVIAYNWPRVLRSTLSKEEKKSLGRGGWTVAFYQQLGKLLGVPDCGLNIVLNILAAFDPYRLSLNIPVSQIMEMVKEEDKLRVAEGKSNRKEKMSKKNTTAERLYNGNPNLKGVKVASDGKVELDPSYFEQVQRQLKAVYDPEFLPKLGFKNPELGKLHTDSH